MASNFHFEHDDRGILRVASELGKKAGNAAATACETAECTVGKSEGLALAGYSDENLLRIEKMANGLLEKLPNLGRLALKTGLRLYASKLEKLKESEGGLLVDAYDTDQKLADVARCLRVLTAYDEPELPLDGNRATISFNGGPEVDFDTFEKAATAMHERVNKIEAIDRKRRPRKPEPVG